ncbi:DUF4224 domain-containing protein [Pseudomonas sp. CR3202]|uniref:DUF4224 domain-containing protein n=1 Tax=Pseudomonas sp. CR3202 TaxID=3351532 RepID=UPI003BF260F0
MPANKQIVEWLSSHCWKYELSAAGKPVVARIYACLRLAGVKPNTATATTEPWNQHL